MSAISSLTILVEDRKAVSDEVNHILSEYGENVKARLGLPVKDKGVSIITVVFEMEDALVDKLVETLSKIDSVKVKLLKV
jgi:putative iron-only hydrogenase system regulator